MIFRDIGNDPIGPDDSLTVQLYKHHKQLANKLRNEEQHKRELADLEERVYQRVMKRIQVEVKNEATPAIREIRRELENLIR